MNDECRRRRSQHAHHQQDDTRCQQHDATDADHGGQRRATIDPNPEGAVARPAADLDVVPANADVTDVGDPQRLAEPPRRLVPERLDRDRRPDRQIDRNTSRRRRFNRQCVDLDDVVDVEPKGGICVGILSNVVPVDGQ